MSETASTTAAGLLKDGCYYIQYKPKNPDSDISFYEGTIRVLRLGADGMKIKQGQNPGAQKASEPVASEIRAAGDLYCRRPRYCVAKDKTVIPSVETGENPDPKGRIPIFARRDYRYYLKTTKVSESDEGFFVRFEVYQFDRDGIWPNPGRRAISMTPSSNPKHPDPKHPCFIGNVIDEDSGQEVGTVSMQWISEYLRRARIVINQVPKIAAKDSKDDPQESKVIPEPEVKSLVESKWKKAFAEAGWEVTIDYRKIEIKKDKVAIKKKEVKITDLHSNKWAVGDLHNAMLQIKEKIVPDKKAGSNSLISIDLDLTLPPPSPDPNHLDLVDKEWCFQIMCAPLLDGFDRGVSFDSGGTDSDNMPREGVAVACCYKFENTKDEYPESWGTAGGKRLQELEDAFFRVAVHEIGHAMGLDHNTKDDGIMNTTDVIAEDSFGYQKAAEDAEDRFCLGTLLASKGFRSLVASKSPLKGSDSGELPLLASFPSRDEVVDQSRSVRLQEEKDKAREKANDSTFATKIKLEFHRDDLDRLRFGADVTVRPGTIFNDGGPLFGDQESARAEGFRLDVSPLLESVPLGAPVRVHIKLTNTSGKEQIVPKELSLSSCALSGTVIDPNGNTRTYWPVKKCGDKDSKMVLKPFDSVSSDLTLLRGPQGALFPTSGGHRVMARVSWGTGSSNFFLEEGTVVQITPAEDERHRIAALKVLATPDALLSLAIGGQHLKVGNAAIKEALADDILKPHFIIVDFKEKAAEGNIGEACALLNAKSVLSFGEIQRIAKIIEEWKKNIKVYDIKGTIEMLKGRVEKLHLDFEISEASYKELNKQLSGLAV